MEMNFGLGSDQATTTVPVIAPGANDSAMSRLHLQLSRMTALTELVARIESADNSTAACQVLADQLQSYLSADQVLVGLCNERSVHCTLAAVSGVSSFHPRGELADLHHRYPGRAGHQPPVPLPDPAPPRRPVGYGWSRAA